MLRTLLLCLTLIAAPVAAQDFPVRIDHAFGTATIPDRPTRVVSLSFIGHDFLLALGVKPHALRKWYGNHPHGVWPWAQDALGDAAPIVMQGTSVMLTEELCGIAMRYRLCRDSSYSRAATVACCSTRP